jgi:DNA polymerase-3 subunit delta
VVAVKTYEADRFLARPAAGIVVFLIHGNDAGLANERARTIARASVTDPADPFQLVRMDGDDIASDPMKLVDEANSVGLFGGKRALWVQAGARAFLQPLEMLLDVPPQDCVIVVEAGALKRDAPLRKLCEGRKNAVSIECYPDSEKDLEQLIDRELTEANLTIDRDAREVLSQLLGIDRLTTRSEMAKLRLYAHGRGRITMEDVRAIIADASGLAMDDAVNAAFSGQLAQVETIATRVFSTGGNASALLGSALRHATALHRVCLDVDKGMSPDAALERARRTPFGRAIAQQLRLWTSPRAARAIETLAAAVDRARRESSLDEEIAARALWTVARLIKPTS